jgi:metal-responsive CopG/Arc/MetJ family transcriptional regulator
MGRTSKGINFSLPDGMDKEIDTRALAHGYANRSEYLRALYEADLHYNFRPMLDGDNMQRVLRVPPNVEGHSLGGAPRQRGK